MITRYVTWVLIALYPLLLVAIAALWLSGTSAPGAASALVATSAFAGVGAVLRRAASAERGRLAVVVRETVHPARVSLWLPQAPR